MFPNRRTSKQAPRDPGDGPAGERDVMSVRIVGDSHIKIECRTNGKRVSIVVSRYNAARILGMLSLFLGFPLTKSAGRKIRI